ncbi:RNA polymerase factor sigma-54, partial [Sediminibacterium sp.]|uniref:RNA polymerase factor sigma-54 n=1 Tax=Sediminibacterium sp. TaxID=1917865 RepID=UPI003F6A2A33
MSLSQSLQQKLLQKLSPQQIQLMKLLQVPTANLEERIKEELEENPALEQGEEGHEEEFHDELKDEFDNSADDDVDPDGSLEEYENVDISEYVMDDDGEIADYKTKDDNYPEMDDQKVIPIKVETSFHEMVSNQLGMLELDERSYKIAEQVVGSLDDDGYLRRELSSIADDLAFRQSLVVEEKEIEDIISQIQQFDPAGIAARDLRECLLLQLKRKTDEGKSVELAVQILTKYFDEFTKKHYEKIQK